MNQKINNLLKTLVGTDKAIHVSVYEYNITIQVDVTAGERKMLQLVNPKPCEDYEFSDDEILALAEVAVKNMNERHLMWTHGPKRRTNRDPWSRFGFDGSDGYTVMD